MDNCFASSQDKRYKLIVSHNLIRMISEKFNDNPLDSLFKEDVFVNQNLKNIGLEKLPSELHPLPDTIRNLLEQTLNSTAPLTTITKIDKALTQLAQDPGLKLNVMNGHLSYGSFFKDHLKLISSSLLLIGLSAAAMVFFPKYLALVAILSSLSFVALSVGAFYHQNALKKQSFGFYRTSTQTDNDVLTDAKPQA